MHDLVIRGGTLVDGTGAAVRTADVAISDGLITEVGRVTGAARETLDADGLVVTPGFVDIPPLCLSSFQIVRGAST